MTLDQIYDLFVEANPVSDPDALGGELPLLRIVDRRREAVLPRPAGPATTKRDRRRLRGPLIALAAFLAVAAIGLSAWLVLRANESGRPPVVDQPAPVEVTVPQPPPTQVTTPPEDGSQQESAVESLEPLSVARSFEAAINSGNTAEAQALLVTEACNFPDIPRNCDEVAGYYVAVNATLTFDCEELPSATGDALLSCTMTEESDLYDAMGVIPDPRPVLLTVEDGAITGWTLGGEFADRPETDSPFFNFVGRRRPDLTTYEGWLILTPETAGPLVEVAGQFRAEVLESGQ